MAPEAVRFEVESQGLTLRGEEVGEGPPIVLVHGVTATRRYVLHGSTLLAREGFRLISYDARGHGESTPAPPGAGYTFTDLADDLERVVEERAGEGKPLLVGHSMGTMTIATLALRRSRSFAGLVLGGPVSLGRMPADRYLCDWDELADGIERDGIDGFMSIFANRPLDPAWRETILTFTRQRMERHRHPEALARVMREMPRSLPFDGMEALGAIDVPTLVVGSRDEADPSHPYRTAAAWAEALPQARLISEGPGESPLTWRGSELSREIARFCTEIAY